MNIEDYIQRGLTHQIHTTQRRSWRGCRRRHNWVFRDMYYPTVTAKPLEFGVAYHKALETLYDPMNRLDGVETAIALARVAFVEKCKEQKRSFISLNPDQYTPEVDTDYSERVQLGLGMLDYWTSSVMLRYEEGLTPVKVEIPFEVPIEPVLWCKCAQCWKRFLKWSLRVQADGGHDLLGPGSLVFDPLWLDQTYEVWSGLPVTYGGRVDVLFEDRNGYYWIGDWKTTTRMVDAEGGASDDFMLLDDQVTSYCWALGHVLQIPIKGFIYVEIKKAYPLQPEPNKVQRLGRWYSVNKNQSTSYGMYRQTVEESDPVAYQAGLYNEFLEFLRTKGDSDYVKWHQIIRNDTELENAGRYIYLEAREIIDVSMPAYPSPGRFSCTTCAFNDPCIGMNRGDDYLYTLDSLYEKHDHHYWESAEPTTDKRSL